MTPIVRALFNVLVVMSLVGTWTFVILYTRTWPWWRNEMARYTVSFSSCLGLFMTYYTLRIFVDEVPFAIWILFGLLTILTVIIWWQLVLFLRIRYEQRRLRRVKRAQDEVN